MKIYLKTILVISCLLILPTVILAVNSTGYAWSENAGWVNTNSTYGGMTVSTTGVTGYFWLENIGWIQLDYDGVAGATNTTSTNWGVVNDGLGNLSGYAWSENIGWLNFDPAHSQVLIDTSGNFSGYAWSENIGWIKFDHSQTANIPATTWRADSTAPVISNVASSLGYLSNTQTATVTWTTNEASSTQLEYGSTTSYGSTTTETDTSTRVTSHTASVALAPCQAYHARVISKDTALNQATGDDFTIQTACASGGGSSSSSLRGGSQTDEAIPAVEIATPLDKLGARNDGSDDQQQIILMQKIIQLLKQIIQILMQKRGV